MIFFSLFLLASALIFLLMSLSKLDFTQTSHLNQTFLDHLAANSNLRNRTVLDNQIEFLNLNLNLQ